MPYLDDLRWFHGTQVGIRRYMKYGGFSDVIRGEIYYDGEMPYLGVSDGKCEDFPLKAGDRIIIDGNDLIIANRGSKGKVR